MRKVFLAADSKLIGAAIAAAVGAIGALTPAVALAEGCYLCGSGSSPQCRDYCRYGGADTFDARKTCEKKGCRVVGPSACPSGGNYAICQAPASPGGPILASVASGPFCAAAPAGG